MTEGTERMGGRYIERSDRPGLDVLRTIWTLAPYERVTRHLWLDADHRGLHRFGPVRLEVRGPVRPRDAVEEHADSAVLLVRPRSVPVRVASPETAPLGLRRARSGLHEDPALFAGVRQRSNPAIRASASTGGHRRGSGSP